MSHPWMSHVTHVYESSHTYEWVMSQTHDMPGVVSKQDLARALDLFPDPLLVLCLCERVRVCVCVWVCESYHTDGCVKLCVHIHTLRLTMCVCVCACMRLVCVCGCAGIGAAVRKWGHDVWFRLGRMGYELCHMWMSHVAYECDMSHMNASWFR